MNIFDIVLIVIVLAFTFTGFLRGFAREIMHLLNWFISGAAAWFFSRHLEKYFTEITEPLPRLMVSFIVIFITVFIIGIIVSFLVNKMVMSRKVLRVPNMILGASVGVVRGLFVILLLFLFAGAFSPYTKQSWWREAFLSPYFEGLAMWTARYLPKDIARHIHYG
jgi:membrane protein required for colicin V production